MKKSIFLVCLFLTACAGNPPAWWDPSNRYAPASQTQTAAPQKAVTSVSQPQEEEEEIFSFETDSDYKEMDISPDEADEISAAQAVGKEGTLAPSILEE